MTSSTFTSNRISKTAAITINALPDKAFPLFGAIKEKDWAAGWDFELLYSTANTIEEHMVFKTPSSFEPEESDYIWTVSKYMPDRALIEYMVHTYERLWWITVQCMAGIAHGKTRAEITYTYTGLTAKGNALNEKALQIMYEQDLKDWEEAINYYLETGKRLE